MQLNSRSAPSLLKPAIVSPGPDPAPPSGSDQTPDTGAPTQPDPTPPVLDGPGGGPFSKVSQTVMGGLSGAQGKAIESQQLLSSVSQLFTARISQVAKDAWALLRGN